MKLKAQINLLNCIALFYSIIVIFYATRNFDLLFLKNFFYQTDFYINYMGGFIRRGLDGQILYYTSNNTDIAPWKIQKLYTGITFIFYLILIFYLLKKYKIPFILLFTMSCLLLQFYCGVRKDHILLSVYTIQVIYLIKNLKSIHKLKCWIITTLLVLPTILIHELYYFIAFFPITILLYLSNNQKLDRHFLKKFLQYHTLPFVFFFLVAIIFPGNLQQKTEILKSWQVLDLTGIRFSKGIFEEAIYIWTFKLHFLDYILIATIIILHLLFTLRLSYIFINNSYYRKWMLYVLIC